jgi:phosphoribosylformylglycinamidine (FGAM) synthase-like enzyme
MTRSPSRMGLGRIRAVRQGRTPTFTELGIVSAMWNEHCSLLKRSRQSRPKPLFANH